MICSSIPIATGGVTLDAEVTVPTHAIGIVLLVEAEASLERRDLLALGTTLGQLGFATLRVDLRDRGERESSHTASWAHGCTQRLAAVVDWAGENALTRALPLGIFCDGAAEAAVLTLAAERPDEVSAVVVLSGRANLAHEVLACVCTPVLLIYGDADAQGVASAHAAAQYLPEARLEMLHGVGRTVDDQGVLERLLHLCSEMFLAHLPRHRTRPFEHPPVEPFSTRPFRDREDAGTQLAAALAPYAHRDDTLVLGLPRDGVVVASAVARGLGVALDALIVRQLRAPGRRQHVIGAIAPEGVMVSDTGEDGHRLAHADVGLELSRQHRALERLERHFRADAPWPVVAGKRVIFVDEGMRTGASMRAAIAWARMHLCARVVVAVPVAPRATVERVALEADEVACLHAPEGLRDFSQAYVDLPRVAEAEVIRLLVRGRLAVERG